MNTTIKLAIIIGSYALFIFLSSRITWNRLGISILTYFKKKYPKEDIPDSHLVQGTPNRISGLMYPELLAISWNEKETVFFRQTIFESKFDSDPKVKELRKKLIYFWVYCTIIFLVIPLLASMFYIL